MIKRVVLMLLIGATIALSGTVRISTVFTGTLTGGASSQDSIYTDTHFIVSGLHYGNRLMGTIILDSIITHEPSGFGLEDSVTMVLKSFYGDQWVTIDSVEKVMDDTETCTLFVVDGRDSLYGDMVVLVIRIADTVGITTDTVVTFRVTTNLLHAFQD